MVQKDVNNIVEQKRFLIINEKGFTPIFAVLVIGALLTAIAVGVFRIDKTLLNFSKAQTVPSADACNSRFKWENNIAQSKFKNADFQSGYTGDGTPNNWSKFVLSGNPQFGEETGYIPFGKSFRVSGDGAFSGGIYQTVEGLQIGKWYHAFYATAQKISGEGGGALPTLREIGVDPNGGVDPSKVSNWGVRNSGGQKDKDARRYGGWKVMGEKNNPLVTFQATSSKATIFIKVSAQSANSGSSNTWIVSAFFGEDCNSGETTNPGTPTNPGGSSGTPSAPSANAPVCDKTRVQMAVEPSSAFKVGDQVTLKLSNTDGSEGETFIDDELINIELKTSNRGIDLPGSYDETVGDWKSNVWPKDPKYLTVEIKQLPFKWTHKWKNCAPNNCQITSDQCTKTFDSSTGQELGGSPRPNSSPPPAASGGPSPNPSTPANLQQAIKSEFGITMENYDQESLRWTYNKLTSVSRTTKFIDLVRNTTITKLPDGTSRFLGLGRDGRCEARRSSVTRTPSEQEFNLILTHELGHVIYYCNQDPQNQRSRHSNVYQKEPGITKYGQTGCGYAERQGVDPRPYAMQEDYADMIAFYLNPGVSDSIRGPECSIPAEPFGNGRNPEHLNLVKSILDK